MIWAKQTKGWGMGNFINITPAITWLSRNGIVPVYFEEPYLKDLVRDWEAVQIVDTMPKNKPTVNSVWANKYDGKTPDWLNILFFVGDIRRVKAYPLTSLSTYCDPVPVPTLTTPYVVFIRGALQGNEAVKVPPDDIYYHIAKKVAQAGLKCVYVGVTADHVRYGDDFVNSFYPVLDNLRAEMSYIRGAEFVITNDTGLYHVAGAYKKKGFVLWKDTDPLKNATPNNNFFISQQNSWYKDFDKWIRFYS